MYIRRMFGRAWSVLWLSLVVGCGSPSTPAKPISLASYDRTCATVDDCAPVFFDEDTCCRSGCPNTAIRASEVARLDKDVSTGMCAGSPPCKRPFMCAGGRIQCVQGLCTLETPDAAAGN
jgi:hypothetical protein